MANNLTSAYAAIIKQEKLEDGTLLVYGKATDDSLDIDQQICDATWLDRAMPEWFKTGGNIREQHSNIAAGVAKEYEQKGDGHYISALVVDPVSVKKVETGVLKGFSIGIRSPRVVRDTKAVNGRIIDGQIVEISLVDRPANPNAKLMLAKSDDNSELVKVEEYSETDETPTVKGELMEEQKQETAVGEKPSREDALRNLESARKQYKEIEAMCKELGYFDNDESKQYGETAEQETEEGPSVGAETAEEEVGEARGEKPLDKADKCLECGCHQPANSHGRDDVSTADMVTPTETPKSTIVPERTIEEVGTVTEEEELESEDSAKSAISDEAVSAIIAKAVKSATDSVVAEVEVLKSALEAEKNTVNKLQDELATAKTKAVSGGPKRTAAPANNDAGKAELLTVAAMYRNKAATTTDQTLAKGYKELALDFEAKAAALTK